jgi:hypothetical protein
VRFGGNRSSSASELCYSLLGYHCEPRSYSSNPEIFTYNQGIYYPCKLGSAEVGGPVLLGFAIPLARSMELETTLGQIQHGFDLADSLFYLDLQYHSPDPWSWKLHLGKFSMGLIWRTFPSRSTSNNQFKVLAIKRNQS